MAQKRLTIEQAAKSLGKTRRTLERWKAKGADGFEMLSGIIYVDLEKLKIWRGGSFKTPPKNFTHTTPTTSDSHDKDGVASGEDVPYEEARRRKELAAAQLKEFELEQKKGDFIHRDELLDLMNRIGQMLKAKIIAQPSRLCATFADIEDARDLHMLWEKEQWELLNSISQEFGVNLE